MARKWTAKQRAEQSKRLRARHAAKRENGNGEHQVQDAPTPMRVSDVEPLTIMQRLDQIEALTRGLRADFHEVSGILQR